MTTWNRAHVVTTEGMAEVDRLMIEAYGIEVIQMMENAGRALAEQAARMLGGSPQGRRVAVVCGAGNNGGGGMVAARHLSNRGAQVAVYLTREVASLKDVPEQQWRILEALGVTGDDTLNLTDADLVIDAIIGYGLQGNPRGIAAEWIGRINEAQRPVLALDTPSGLDTTSGIPGTPCVRATATLTLALPKTGLLRPEARAVVGALYVADISVPPTLYRRLGLDVPPLFARDSIVAVQR